MQAQADARMQKLLGFNDDSSKASGGGALLVVVVVVVVAAVAVAYRYKLLPPSLVATVRARLGLKAAEEEATPDESSAPAASATTTATTDDAYAEVTGSVLFKGGEHGESGCCECHHLDVHKYTAEQRVGDNPCLAKVDPCSLIETTLDAAPTCHTVTSLCDAKTVPNQEGRGCMIKEMCGFGCGGGGNLHTKNYLESVTVPKGMTLQVTGDPECATKPTFSQACTDTDQCTYEQHHYQDDVGMQFAIAPGYKLTCGTKTHRGQPKA